MTDRTVGGWPLPQGQPPQFDALPGDCPPAVRRPRLAPDLAGRPRVGPAHPGSPLPEDGRQVPRGEGVPGDGGPRTRSGQVTASHVHVGGLPPAPPAGPFLATRRWAVVPRRPWQAPSAREDLAPGHRWPISRADRRPRRLASPRRWPFSRSPTGSALQRRRRSDRAGR